MNCQEIFDKVATHLLTQNKKALEGSFCSYLTTDGLKCAVGCIIPDGHPAQFSSGGLYTITKAYTDLFALWKMTYGSREYELLSRLQIIHDSYLPKDWKYRLLQLTKNPSYNLNPSVVTNWEKES